MIRDPGWRGPGEVRGPFPQRLPNPRITVDGTDVPQLARLWALSPRFSLDVPEGNIFGIPAMTSNAVGGAWLAMIDLPAGAHQIVVYDETFDADVLSSAKLTANINVAASK